MTEHEHDAIIALLKLVLAGGGNGGRRALLDAHDGDAVRALAMAGAPGSPLDPGQRARLRQPDTPTLQEATNWLAEPGHHLVGWNSTDYPPLLRSIPSPPLALFVDGDPALLWHPAIAVVGSRRATMGGCDNASAFARAFAASGLCVASGMAAGIDACAHAAALSMEEGLTIAVVGTGPDLAYPAAHSRLRDRIAERGAVISEFPPGTRPRKEHFPSRNRILAGLTLGTVVVEAAERSGALITARQAADSGREVFALPGSIHNPQARGCHRLIRDGATLVQAPSEVIDALAPMAAELGASLRRRLTREAGPAANEKEADPHGLWHALGHDPTAMDTLVERTGLTAAELSSMLLAMELDGRVAVEYGRYSRRP